MSRNPFLVPITALRRSGIGRQVERRQGNLEGLAISGAQVAPGRPVEVDVVLESVDGGIVVSGTVKTTWTSECRRCLAPVDRTVQIGVRELYESRPSELASSEADEDTYPLTGDEVDLSLLARDAVMLNLPVAALCRPDCAGLCSTCGADLNDGACGCSTQRRDLRWTALDVLGGAELS